MKTDNKRQTGLIQRMTTSSQRVEEITEGRKNTIATIGVILTAISLVVAVWFGLKALTPGSPSPTIDKERSGNDSKAGKNSTNVNVGGSPVINLDKSARHDSWIKYKFEDINVTSDNGGSFVSLPSGWKQGDIDTYLSLLNAGDIKHGMMQKILNQINGECLFVAEDIKKVQPGMVPSVVVVGRWNSGGHDEKPWLRIGKMINELKFGRRVVIDGNRGKTTKLTTLYRNTSKAAKYDKRIITIYLISAYSTVYYIVIDCREDIVNKDPDFSVRVLKEANLF